MAEASAGSSRHPPQDPQPQTQEQSKDKDSAVQEQLTADTSSTPRPEQSAAPIESIESDPKLDAGDGSNGAQPASQVTEEQWKAMFEVVMAIYEHRLPDGHDPSRPFHKSVNKRNVPDYYDVIKEPMALSLLKQKIKLRTYTHFSEFVRDCALIPHNAQTYNRPRSQVYDDSVAIKGVFVSEFKKLADLGIISAETAELPDLGEIPDTDLPPNEEEEEEEEEDDEEEEEEAEDSDEEGGRRKRRKIGRPSKRDSNVKDDTQRATDPEFRKKRGRPPRVDTPMEARIKAVLKGIRKFKDTSGQLKVRHFEKLPDKTVYPDYYMEIKEPMAIDLIKRKSKRKKYNSVDHLMRDIDVMFNNAKQYNQSESQLYKDAEHLHAEAHKLAEQEKKKPDSEYLMEDGRLPLPGGILHKGEVWKVGDWVHLENPNDVNKPIVAQIYRTWQDSDSQKWVNACWYYRPEQTVHQYEKHFYPNEVVKTGQYRDHRIEEVVDRCFVMFFTRYNRGRPRGLPPDKEVYVCEARYNEEKHKLNKIKTWASCLPDEVREKDYEMDLFEAPRKIRKIPSPIKHLLKPDARETDDLPKPTWGAENAPPIVGAVHRRPREENESPPPEPTPSPPPAPPPVPAMPALPINKAVSSPQPITRPQSQNGIRSHTSAGMNPMGGIANLSPVVPPPQQLPVSSQIPMASARMHMQPPQLHQTPGAAAAHPSLPASYPNRASNYMPHTPHTPHAAMYQNMVPQSHAQQQPQPQALPQQHVPQVQAQPMYSAPHNFPSYQASRVQAPQFQPNTYNPNAPRPVEAFRLNDQLSSAIPSEVRSQFQCDAQGRVLFFSTPPLDVVAPTHGGLAHSVEYLAAREERKNRVAEYKRKRAEERQAQEEAEKKRRIEEDADRLKRLERLQEQALLTLTANMELGTEFLNRQLADDSKEVSASKPMSSELNGVEKSELIVIGNGNGNGNGVEQKLSTFLDEVKEPSKFVSMKRSGILFMTDLD